MAIEKAKMALSKFPEEADGRSLVDKMAPVLQGTALAETVPDLVTDAFCKTRFSGESVVVFGAVPETVAVDALIDRAMPA